jgi:hypothetical protein
MGLDMYAYMIAPNDAVSPLELAKDTQRHELAYWRKHHDLHGWMEALYFSKGGTEEFNCQVIELTHEDINNLATAIEMKHLPSTGGFFFGNNPPNEDSNNEDMNFIQKARKALDSGMKVYYDSWW